MPVQLPGTCADPAHAHQVCVCLQHDWRITEPSTWASEQPLQLSKIDQRMLLASLAPSNPGVFVARATAFESMICGTTAAAARATAPHRPSDEQALPGLQAWTSVQSFLRSPDELARDHQSDISSQSSPDDDDHDIPQALILNEAVASRCSSARSARNQSRPHTALRAPKQPLLIAPGATPDDVGGNGHSVALQRPHTAHAGALSPKARLQRRMTYKPPKPRTEEVTGYKRAAQARFRT